jgi:hypothetical protein
MQSIEDSNLQQVWRLTDTLIRIRNGALTQDVLKVNVDPDELLKTIVSSKSKKIHPDG